MGHKRNSRNNNEGKKRTKKSDIVIPETSPIRREDISDGGLDIITRRDKFHHSDKVSYLRFLKR